MTHRELVIIGECITLSSIIHHQTVAYILPHRHQYITFVLYICCHGPDQFELKKKKKTNGRRQYSIHPLEYHHIYSSDNYGSGINLHARWCSHIRVSLSWPAWPIAVNGRET